MSISKPVPNAERHGNYSNVYEENKIISVRSPCLKLRKGKLANRCIRRKRDPYHDRVAVNRGTVGPGINSTGL